MTFHRFAFAALAACSLLAGPADALATPSRAALDLSTAGKRALSSRSISVTSVPRGPSSSPSFAIGGWTVGTSARIKLNGALRFSAGKRKVSASNLAVTISRTSSSVTARLGKRNVRLFALSPTRPAVLDAEQQHASLLGARVALTRAAATALKSDLKLERAPSTKALGKLTVAVAPELTTPPAVAPAPPTPVALPAPAPADPTPTPTPTAIATVTPTATATPTATPSVTATPGPTLTCPDRFGATPVGILDWFSCDLPGSGDLKRWTDYIGTGFPPAPCQGPLGTVVPGGGAAEVVAGDAYDHRFPILSSETRPDGSATIVAGGDVTYTMPVHGIDEAIGAFRLEIAAGGQSGIVYASGRFKTFDMGASVCTRAPQTYANQPVLTLDLSAVTPVTAGGVTRWVHVPAKIATGVGDKISGGTYPAGSAWGSFTIAIPSVGAAG